MIKQVFKTMVAFLAVATMTISPAWGQNSSTSSLVFTEAYGTGGATADDNVVWTVTSDGTESNFDDTKGIHYGTSKLQVQYIQLSTSDIIGTITQVKVNASTASGVNDATVSVTVGGNAFGGNAQGLSINATDYTFTGSATGEIVVRVAKSSAAIRALYVKSVVVTYTPASSSGGSGSEPPTPGQNASEENIFQFCYDCQRNPAYPKTTASTSLSGFANPLVGYNGSGFEVNNTPAGPWKLEYMGIWSTTNQYGIEDFRVSNYQSTYNCTDVPVFRLYQWNATANEYQHASYGVVCAYAKVTNAVEHTAFFEAADGWGCVLTNSSHSSSMNITFDEDLTTGITTLIPAPAVPHTVRFADGNDGWTVTDVDSARSATAPAVLQNVMAGDSLVATYNGTQKVKSVKAVKYVPPVVITWNSTNVFNNAHRDDMILNTEWASNPLTYEGVTISMSAFSEQSVSTFLAYNEHDQAGGLSCFGEDGDSFTFTAPSGKKFCKIEIIDDWGVTFTNYGDWREGENNNIVWSGTAASTVTLGSVQTSATRLTSIVFTLIDD